VRDTALKLEEKFKIFCKNAEKKDSFNLVFYIFFFFLTLSRKTYLLEKKH